MKAEPALIFDLDGVLVDTASLHYGAWKRLADSLGIAFGPADNERLKGVSRRASLDIILGLGGLQLPEAEKGRLADLKNSWYREKLAGLDEGALLPGVRAFLEAARAAGHGLALGSASQSAREVLGATGIAPLFDAVVDGTDPAAPKPAPDLFLLAARRLGAPPADCVVFEDAAAGVEAALAAGMGVVGIGSPAALGRAHLVVPGFAGREPRALLAALAAARG